MAMPNPSALLIALLSSHFLAQAYPQSALTSFPQQAGFGSIQPSNPNSVPFGSGSTGTTQLPGSVDQTAPNEPNYDQSRGGFQQGYSQQNPNTPSSTSSSAFNQLPFTKNTRQGLANINNNPFSNGANAVGAFTLMYFLVVIVVIIA